MTPFKVGDRVSFTIDDEPKKYRGQVYRLMPYGNLMLRSDPDTGTYDGCAIVFPVVHPKQCGRLKPKRKPREWVGVWERCYDTETEREGLMFTPEGFKLNVAEETVMTLREVLAPRKKVVRCSTCLSGGGHTGACK